MASETAYVYALAQVAFQQGQSWKGLTPEHVVARNAEILQELEELKKELKKTSIPLTSNGNGKRARDEHGDAIAPSFEERVQQELAAVGWKNKFEAQFPAHVSLHIGDVFDDAGKTMRIIGYVPSRKLYSVVCVLNAPSASPADAAATVTSYSIMHVLKNTGKDCAEYRALSIKNARKRFDISDTAIQSGVTIWWHGLKTVRVVEVKKCRSNTPIVVQTIDGGEEYAITYQTLLNGQKGTWS